jgi:hypothetical protein
MSNELLYHYSNPRFEGKPWAIEQKKRHANQRKKKHYRGKKKRRTVKLGWRADPVLMDRQRKARQFLEAFWPEFEKMPNTDLRLKLLRKAANPPWPRIDDRVRMKLRRDFARKWVFLLTEIDAYCGVCGNMRWKEKHHVVPLSHGGLNENLGLLAICIKCHEEIHPWLKT